MAAAASPYRDLRKRRISVLRRCPIGAAPLEFGPAVCARRLWARLASGAGSHCCAATGPASVTATEMRDFALLRGPEPQRRWFGGSVEIPRLRSASGRVAALLTERRAQVLVGPIVLCRFSLEGAVLILRKYWSTDWIRGQLARGGVDPPEVALGLPCTTRHPPAPSSGSLQRSMAAQSLNSVRELRLCAVPVGKLGRVLMWVAAISRRMAA